MLQPWLEKVFALKREQAACQLPDRDPYDALMDDFEPGARWAVVAQRFERLRAQTAYEGSLPTTFQRQGDR